MIDTKTFRILHILSPVKWDGGVFDSSSDSNWKVVEKTIGFLPNCHHYILCPINHNITLRASNVSFIKYDYPKSVQLNRGMFDYRQIKFDFTRCDIDFVFSSQGELLFNVHQWFHSNRYYEDVSYFNFYHWIDCNESRGSVSGCPSFYMRQLESMHIADANFIHSDKSIEYLKSNFKDIDISSLLGKIYYMPVTSKIDVTPTSFELPNKKILLFNHRWNESSGIKKLIEYTVGLPEEYVIWVTDESCDLKQDNVIIKSLKFSDYAYLLVNCYASLCFISGYSTWNLSAQDSSIMGRPLLYYKNETISRVVGEKYGGSFSNKKEFLSLLDNLPIADITVIKEHDLIFEAQLKLAMSDCWKEGKTAPKDAEAWTENIKKGVVDKKSIAGNVNDKVRLNGTAHFIRRWLLNNGIKDNIHEPYTQYYLESDTTTIKKNLFTPNVVEQSTMF